MRTLLTVLFSCMIVSSSLSAEPNTEEMKPFQWVPIYGLARADSNSYVDQASLGTTAGDETVFNIGVVLLSFKAPVTMKVQKGTITFSSIATSIIADCKTGIAAPVAGMYFNTPFPTVTQRPIAMIEYKDVSKNGVVLSKHSPLYQTLCPLSI